MKRNSRLLIVIAWLFIGGCATPIPSIDYKLPADKKSAHIKLNLHTDGFSTHYALIDTSNCPNTAWTMLGTLQADSKFNETDIEAGKRVFMIISGGQAPVPTAYIAGYQCSELISFIPIVGSSYEIETTYDSDLCKNKVYVLNFKSESNTQKNKELSTVKLGPISDIRSACNVIKKENLL